MDIQIIEDPGSGKDFSAVQKGDVVILPAFGASVQEMQLLNDKEAIMVDTTCPWVSKVSAYRHQEAVCFICGAPLDHVDAAQPTIRRYSYRLLASSLELPTFPVPVAACHCAHRQYRARGCEADCLPCTPAGVERGGQAGQEVAHVHHPRQVGARGDGGHSLLCDHLPDCEGAQYTTRLITLEDPHRSCADGGLAGAARSLQRIC